MDWLRSEDLKEEKVVTTRRHYKHARKLICPEATCAVQKVGKGVGGGHPIRFGAPQTVGLVDIPTRFTSCHRISPRRYCQMPCSRQNIVSCRYGKCSRNNKRLNE